MKQPFKEMLKKIGGEHLLKEASAPKDILIKALKLANLDSKVKYITKDKGMNFAQVEFKHGGFLSVYTNSGGMDGDFETPSGKYNEYDAKDVNQLAKILKKNY